MLRRSILILFVAFFLWTQSAWWLLRAAAALPATSERGSHIRLLSVSQNDPDSIAAVPADGPEWELPHSSGEMLLSDTPNEEMAPACSPPVSLDEYAGDTQLHGFPEYETPTESFFSKLQWLGLRHSSTHGRHAGLGVPFQGTSWLNRPYYVGFDLGPMWVTHPPRDNITDDIDLFGGLFIGYDCDYYWGIELAVQRATPELINEDDRDAPRGDRMMLWTANVVYYPWGDSMFRPYWRCGVGAMEIDYPSSDGRRDEALWAVPVGVGIKYPIRRWLATRMEFTDNIGLGNDGIATQHNLTLTFALEWRYGAHARSYWPWNPSRHIW